MAGEESKEEPSPTEDFTFTAQEQLADMNEAERKAVDEAGGFQIQRTNLQIIPQR